MIRAIMVHGGLKPLSEEEKPSYEEGCMNALRIGWGILKDGGCAIDVVQQAVQAMEDDPIFNAGPKGSARNERGQVEMDAAIMFGPGLKAGCVAAVTGIKNPVSLARALYESGTAVMIVGEGAKIFADKAGNIASYSSDYIVSTRNQSSPDQGNLSDTVGCIALDAAGNLAAATSTGGLSGKAPGRVGDSPLVGCGLYADDIGAVALTGDGESIIRTTLASRITMLLHSGLQPQTAADAAIEFFDDHVVGEAGCIVLDKLGRFGFSHNARNMACAYMSDAMSTALVFTK